MWIIRWIRIRNEERGFLFRKGEFVRLLGPGFHWIVGPIFSTRVDRMSVRKVWIAHPDLEVVVRGDALEGDAIVLDLAQHERAVVWVNGRVDSVVGPGLHALWTSFHRVRIDRFDAREPRFDHPSLGAVLGAPGTAEALVEESVPEGWSGLVFFDGRLVDTIGPGVYAYWRGETEVKVFRVERREQTLDVSGQEILSSEKVALRLNALVSFRLADPAMAMSMVDDARQALYRRAQLAIRAVVGTREIDALLADKEGVAAELFESLAPQAEAFGVEVLSLGIRDVILPGEMKEVMNRVTEARKVAEAALITRREETAAMRSQANTARIFESNPALMRLRELEVLEKVAENADLSVILGEGGLKDRLLRLV